MPRMKLDATTAVLFGEVDVDRYVVELTDVKGPEKSKGGTMMVTVEGTIIEGVETGEKFANQKLWRNCPIEGKGAGIFIDVWNKAHADDEDAQLEVGGEIDVDTDDLIGKRVVFVCGEHEYPEGSGEFRTQVDRVLSV